MRTVSILSSWPASSLLIPDQVTFDLLLIFLTSDSGKMIIPLRLSNIPSECVPVFGFGVSNDQKKELRSVVALALDGNGSVALHGQPG